MIIQNESISQFTERLTKSKPEWELVTGRFRRTQALYLQALRGGGIGNLTSVLGKLSVQCALEDLCRTQADAEYSPITNGEKTRSYIFYYARGRIMVRGG